MSKSRKEEFTAWLELQTGCAYVWGAQGQRIEDDGGVYKGGKLVNKSYEEWIKQRETSERNALRAAAFIQKKLDEGECGFACYDCSGLIMAYLKDIKGYLSTDMSARGIFSICEEITRDELMQGDLVFYHNGEKITHVGVYIGDGFTVDARSRDCGVVKRRLEEVSWNRFARLPILQQNDDTQSDAPFYARCTGPSVNVRSGAGNTYPILAIAHAGDRMLVMPAENGWHRIAICAKGRLLTGYMNEKYVLPV